MAQPVLRKASFAGICQISFLVGYAQNNLKSGYSLVTPQFLTVGAEAMPLQSITATGEGTSDNVNIQTLDAAGYTVDSYLWNDWVAEKPCWVNDRFEPVEGVIIQPGQGLWVGGSSTGQSIRFPAPEL